MIISVPASWNFFHNSRSWRTTLMFSMFWKRLAITVTLSSNSKLEYQKYVLCSWNLLNQDTLCRYGLKRRHCTWLGSLALGMVGAVARSSRGSSERRSGWTPSWTWLIHPSVTAETFSCSISAGLRKYSAVRYFQGLSADALKVDNAHFSFLTSPAGYAFLIPTLRIGMLSFLLKILLLQMLGGFI